MGTLPLGRRGARVRSSRSNHAFGAAESARYVVMRRSGLIVSLS